MKPIFLFLTLLSNFLLNAQETIKNEEAAMCYRESFAYLKEGNIIVPRAIFLLNKADSLEPDNAMILNERGLTKFNFQQDVEGAIRDFTRSIELTTDQKLKENRYNNRGLCYLALGDIESACKDFNRSGEEGVSYMKQYCQRSFTSKIESNPNSDILISLDIKNPNTSIRSTYRPNEMSPMLALINIKNVNHAPLYVSNSNFDYGLETGESTLYLEAMDAKGTKFDFYSESNYIVFSEREDLVLKSGDQYEFEQDLMTLHHFPYPGKYRVRVAMRPSVNTKGLEETYYSNWVEIEVISSK